jgi:hypothetical protein
LKTAVVLTVKAQNNTVVAVGNNPMVGATVACAVAVEEASK